MGNLVAKRCDALGNPRDIDLVWFLQLMSHQIGLKKLSAELIERYPSRIATTAMQRHGTDAGQVYGSDVVREVRKQIPCKGSEKERHFPLKGEFSALPSRIQLLCHDNGQWLSSRAADWKEWAQSLPDCYPVKAFLDECRDGAGGLEQVLSGLCLDPAVEVESCSPWYFPNLIDTLREYQASWVAERQAGHITTSLGRLVHQALDYAGSARRLVLVDGMARTGKTFAVKDWCDRQPGQARYIQVPSSNDDMGFFRAIAKALGVSINQNSKAQQLRDRVEDVAQRGHLTMVFDEAHYLWPQSNYREALPSRINWIMTALVNHNVPVALITTPQFMRHQKALERKTCWTGEQFTGRIGHYEKLPDTLPKEDLTAVSKSLLPEGCAKSIELLAAYAQASAKYLAGIDAVVRRARFLASNEGRQDVLFDDLKSAIQGSVIPSDAALSEALAETRQPKRSRAIAPAPQAARAIDAEPAPIRRNSEMPAPATNRNLPVTEFHASREDLVSVAG